MPIAITPNETWRFQLEEDYEEKPVRTPEGTIVAPGRPSKLGTWWTLRSLPAHVEQAIKDLIQLEFRGDGSIVHANRGSVERMILEHGVVSVENFRTAAGHDVPIKHRTINGRDVADLAFLDNLTPNQRQQIADAVYLRQKVTAAESD